MFQNEKCSMFNFEVTKLHDQVFCSDVFSGCTIVHGKFSLITSAIDNCNKPIILGVSLI